LSGDQARFAGSILNHDELDLVGDRETWNGDIDVSLETGQNALLKSKGNFASVPSFRTALSGLKGQLVPPFRTACPV
jgi:hypothetical protein